VWLLLFAYQDVAYSHQLWWQFELDANAPRGLRAALGSALVLLAVGLAGGEHERRPVKAVLQARRDDADHALVELRMNTQMAAGASWPSSNRASAT